MAVDRQYKETSLLERILQHADQRSPKMKIPEDLDAISLGIVSPAGYCWYVSHLDWNINELLEVLLVISSI
jgi:hypothetical protein